MKITFIGSSHGVPEPGRKCACFLLEAGENVYFVDMGTDGIQAHTLTLWRLLERYAVPTFLFINKMDLPGMEREKLLQQLQEQLSPGCIDFGMREEEIAEAAAMCDEALLENYLESGTVTEGNLRELVAKRKGT